MLSTLGNWFSNRGKNNVINKYTKDLAEITSKIHYLDQKLKTNDQSLAHFHKLINFYGLSLVVLILSVIYVYYRNYIFLVIGCIPCILFIILSKFLLNKGFDIQRRRSLKKIDELRVLHQEKLESLKKDTDFYSTTSLIQRFSSGEYSAEDVSTLMDEELQEKYQELKKLKEELSVLKKNNKLGTDISDEREKWFDKVFDVLSGGDLSLQNRLKPIICSKCNEHNGCFIVSNSSWKYDCPSCHYKMESGHESAPSSLKPSIKDKD